MEKHKTHLPDCRKLNVTDGIPGPPPACCCCTCCSTFLKRGARYFLTFVFTTQSETSSTKRPTHTHTGRRLWLRARCKCISPHRQRDKLYEHVDTYTHAHGLPRVGGNQEMHQESCAVRGRLLRHTFFGDFYAFFASPSLTRCDAYAGTHFISAGYAANAFVAPRPEIPPSVPRNPPSSTEATHTHMHKCLHRNRMSDGICTAKKANANFLHFISRAL